MEERSRSQPACEQPREERLSEEMSAKATEKHEQDKGEAGRLNQEDPEW